MYNYIAYNYNNYYILLLLFLILFFQIKVNSQTGELEDLFNDVASFDHRKAH